MKPASVIAIVALFAAVGGHTSQTHYQGVPLERVVQRCDVVVVAVPADPPRRTVEVDITPAGQKKNKEKWPPYTRSFSRWTVREILLDAAPTSLVGAQRTPPKKPLQVGDVVEVESANARSELELHKKYYVERISKSPIYEQYVVDGESADPARILLLERDDKSLRFAVAGAAEFVEHRAAVEALLKP